MKELLKAALLTLLDYLPEELSHLAAGALSLIDSLNIPPTDPKWEQVAEYTAAILADIRAARYLSKDERMQVRLAAERRFHHQLRDLGLIERTG